MIKKLLGMGLLSLSLLAATPAMAQLLKFKTDVTNGQRTIVMANYMTASFTVNLNPGPIGGPGDSVDVTITNPATNATSANNLEVVGAPPTLYGGSWIGVLTTWPNKDTKAVYNMQGISTPCRVDDSDAQLSPGASCTIRFYALDGSPAGSQTVQIKGENTEAITVTVNVSIIPTPACTWHRMLVSANHSVALQAVPPVLGQESSFPNRAVRV